MIPRQEGLRSALPWTCTLPLIYVDVHESQPWGAFVGLLFSCRVSSKPSWAVVAPRISSSKDPPLSKARVGWHTTPGTTPPPSGRHVVTMQWGRGDGLRNGCIVFACGWLPWRVRRQPWVARRATFLVLRAGTRRTSGSRLARGAPNASGCHPPHRGEGCDLPERAGPVQTGKESRRSPLPLRPITGGDDPVCLFTAGARDARGRASLTGRACGSGRHTAPTAERALCRGAAIPLPLPVLVSPSPPPT